ncbi:MAG: response regulator [Myxococcaceae bacterium]|nr:MAG: response regulator [Myxococcaceae bacterium]
MSAGRTVSSRSSPETMVAVIEDDAAARRALTRMLRAHGLRVASFSTAEELLQSFAETRPGCLVIDVMLPGMSGPDLVERLRTDKVSPPAIFVTGRIDAPEMLRRRGLGDVPCLLKPFEPALLVQAVSRALKTAPAHS